MISFSDEHFVPFVAEKVRVARGGDFQFFLIDDQNIITRRRPNAKRRFAPHTRRRRPVVFPNVAERPRALSRRRRQQQRRVFVSRQCTPRPCVISRSVDSHVFLHGRRLHGSDSYGTVFIPVVSSYDADNIFSRRRAVRFFFFFSFSQ